MIFIYDDYYNKFLKYDKDIVAINLSNLLTTSYIAIFTRKSGLLKEQTKFVIEELTKDMEEK